MVIDPPFIVKEVLVPPIYAKPPLEEDPELIMVHDVIVKVVEPELNK